MYAFYLQLLDLAEFSIIKAFLVFFIFVWSIWFSKLVASKLYKPVKKEHRLPFSVIIPVYNESLELFEKVLKSIKDRGPSQIIVAVD